MARYSRRKPVTAQIVSGVLFGSLCVTGMMLPIEFGSGVIFDPCSVVLSMDGLFDGPIVAAVSAAIASGYRLWLGFVGTPVGVAVIFVCVELGLAYRYACQHGWLGVGARQLLLFGFIVHLNS
ncbi:MAG: hypothetical protein ACI9DC_000325 [Gammaproteobacteria bacterium]